MLVIAVPTVNVLEDAAGVIVILGQAAAFTVNV